MEILFIILQKSCFRPLTGSYAKYSTKYRKNKGLEKLYFILHAERLHDMMQIKETAQDKTVAEFPGANKVTVSQRHKTWQQKLLRIRAEQEDV